MITEENAIEETASVTEDLWEIIHILEIHAPDGSPFAVRSNGVMLFTLQLLPNGINRDVFIRFSDILPSMRELLETGLPLLGLTTDMPDGSIWIESPPCVAYAFWKETLESREV